MTGLSTRDLLRGVEAHPGALVPVRCVIEHHDARGDVKHRVRFARPINHLEFREFCAWRGWPAEFAQLDTSREVGECRIAKGMQDNPQDRFTHLLADRQPITEGYTNG